MQESQRNECKNTILQLQLKTGARISLECVVAEFWSVGVLLRCLGSGWRRLWVPISPRGLGAIGFSITIWKPKNFLSTSALDRTTRVDRSTDWCPSFPGWQRIVRWRHWTVWWPKLAVGALGEEQSSRWRDCLAHTGLFGEFYKLNSWDRGLRPYGPLDRPVHHWASPRLAHLWLAQAKLLQLFLDAFDSFYTT
jgi:hypothetical protein